MSMGDEPVATQRAVMRMGIARGAVGADAVDTQVIELLGHRYADGLVYFGEASERGVFDRAVRLGLVSRDGYLTREGRAIVARYSRS